MGAAVFLFGLTLRVRQSSLYLETASLWLVAIAGFIGVAAILGRPGIASARAQRIALLLAATVVLVHNQVEMAFFQPTSMGLLWVIVGAAAGGGLKDVPQVENGEQDAPRNKRLWVVGGVALLCVAALGWMLVYAVGATRHESAMNGARAALLRGDVPLAVDRLAVAQHAAGLDTAALRWRVRLHALEPWRYLVDANRGGEARQRIDDALMWVNEASSSFDGGPATVARLRVQLLGQLTEGGGVSDAYIAAEEAGMTLFELSPYNIQDEWARAELARGAGKTGLARQRYERVLMLREQKYLDAADPLTSEQLQQAKAFLQAQGD